MKKIVLLATLLAASFSAVAEGRNPVPGIPGYDYTYSKGHRPVWGHNDRNRWIAPAIIGGLIAYTIINGQRVPVQPAPEVIYYPPPPPPQPEVIYVPVPQPQPRIEYVERPVWYESCRCWRWTMVPVQY